MELGGEFYLDLNALSEKHHSVEGYLSDEHPLYFDSGRSALRFAARSLRSGTILLPECICDSVITAFSSHTPRSYRLTPSLEIDMDDLLSTSARYNPGPYWSSWRPPAFDTAFPLWRTPPTAYFPHGAPSAISAFAVCASGSPCRAAVRYTAPRLQTGIAFLFSPAKQMTAAPAVWSASPCFWTGHWTATRNT